MPTFIPHFINSHFFFLSVPFPSFAPGLSDSCTFLPTACHTPSAPPESPSVFYPQASSPHRHYRHYHLRHRHSHLHRYTCLSGQGHRPLLYAYWIILCSIDPSIFLLSFSSNYRQLPLWTYLSVLFLGHLQ
jgi:hypothetical protein